MKNKSHVPFSRWVVAQKSEREYWNKYDSKSIFKESEGRNPQRTEEMLSLWNKWKKIDKNSKVLQVGCGPEDVINYLPMKERYSIDPLADFYKEKFKLDYKASHLQKGVGEKIPFKEESFDLVILANVLDHVHDPDKVLSEVFRVLKKDGLFHFEVTTYQKNFLRLAKVFSKLKEVFLGEIFNIYHPYMFTTERIDRLIRKKFKIIYKDKGKSALEGLKNMEELKERKKESKVLTVKIPALFGLYGTINYTLLCKKI